MHTVHYRNCALVLSEDFPENPKGFVYSAAKEHPSSNFICLDLERMFNGYCRAIAHRLLDKNNNVRDGDAIFETRQLTVGYS
jgi:hypothetical protein